MTGEDPHADSYPPPAAHVNDTAASPPQLERMLAEHVLVRITFGDGSAYVAEFGPCWADLGNLRPGDPGGLGPALTGPRDLAALPELTPRAMGLDVHQRFPSRGPLTAPPPLGQIRTVPPPAQ